MPPNRFLIQSFILAPTIEGPVLFVSEGQCMVVNVESERRISGSLPTVPAQPKGGSSLGHWISFAVK